MKKIITFLVMFLMTGGILMAQSFRYQAVLRDSQNHLVTNQSGTVSLRVEYNVVDGEGVAYWPEYEFTTNQNGLVSFLLPAKPQTEDGEEEVDVNWDGATIFADFNFTRDGQNQTISVVTPVTAVPYALQAGDVKLTTDAIVRYLDNGDEDYMTDGWDWERIYAAMKENPAHNALRDSVVEYIKANKDLAKEIVISYIGLVSAQDLRDAYDSALNVSEEVKTAFYDNVKDYFMSHRQLIVDVAEYFILTATEDEITDVYNDLKNSPAAFEAQRILKRYFEAYLRNHGLICNGVTLCDVVTTLNAMSTCPSQANFEGDQGVTVYTATVSTNNVLSVDFSNVQNLGTDFTVDFTSIKYRVNGQPTTITRNGVVPDNKVCNVTLDDREAGTSVIITLVIRVPGCPTVELNPKTITE
jgi:hypothetical protein